MRQYPCLYKELAHLYEPYKIPRLSIFFSNFSAIFQQFLCFCSFFFQGFLSLLPKFLSIFFSDFFIFMFLSIFFLGFLSLFLTFLLIFFQQFKKTFLLIFFFPAFFKLFPTFLSLFCKKKQIKML